MENDIETGAMTAEEYIAKINDIKQNMVDKVEYDRIAKENRTLAEALTNGGGTGFEEPLQKPDIDDIRKSLFNEKNRKTNLDYFTEVIALRDAVLDQDGTDIFLPNNHEYISNSQDKADAERIANNIKECIEYADGNPEIFTNELQRRCGVARNKK